MTPETEALLGACIFPMLILFVGIIAVALDKGNKEQNK